MFSKIDYEDISGRKKQGKYYFSRPLELKLIEKLLPLVPSFIKTYHLTLVTLFLSVVVIFVSFLAKNNLKWLGLSSFLIVLQYLSDALDGEVGRKRKTGLIKWGFYMDHFLDFVFGSSLIVGYSIIFPQDSLLFFLILMVLSGFFVHGLLLCVLTGKYNVTGYYRIGGPELWMFLIMVNTYAIVFEPQRVTGVFTLFFLIFLVGLILEVGRTQKNLWQMDLKKKKDEDKNQKQR